MIEEKTGQRHSSAFTISGRIKPKQSKTNRPQREGGPFSRKEKKTGILLGGGGGGVELTIIKTPAGKNQGKN